MKNTRWIVEVTHENGYWDACFGGPETLAATKDQTYEDVGKFIEANKQYFDCSPVNLKDGNHLVGVLLSAIGHNILHGDRDSKGAILSNLTCGAQVGIITGYKHWHAVVDRQKQTIGIEPISKKECKQIASGCLKRATDLMTHKRLH